MITKTGFIFKMLSARHVLTKGFTVILVIVLPLPVEPTTFLRAHKRPVLLLRNSSFLMSIKKGGWCFFFFFPGAGTLKTLASKWKGQEECKSKEPGGGGHSGGSTSKLRFAKWRKTLSTMWKYCWKGFNVSYLSFGLERLTEKLDLRCADVD